MAVENMELTCVKKDKYCDVHLCYRDGMLISFADINLHQTDRWVDKEAMYETACKLGDEIVKSFNNRNNKTLNSTELIQLTQERFEIENKNGDLDYSSFSKGFMNGYIQANFAENHKLMEQR